MRAGTTPNGQPRSTALYEAILRLDNLDDCIRFFEDLCAVTELRTMEQRYDVAGCLLQGKVYSEIRQLTGASSATDAPISIFFVLLSHPTSNNNGFSINSRNRAIYLAPTAPSIKRWSKPRTQLHIGRTTIWPF